MGDCESGDLDKVPPKCPQSAPKHPMEFRDTHAEAIAPYDLPRITMYIVDWRSWSKTLPSRNKP